MDRPVRELNLELGRPDAAEAIRRLAAEVEAARKRGQVGGRPHALSAAQRVEVRKMRDEELRPLPEIAQIFRVSVKTVRRA